MSDATVLTAPAPTQTAQGASLNGNPAGTVPAGAAAPQVTTPPAAVTGTPAPTAAAASGQGAAPAAAKYDLKLPDGAVLDTKAVEAITSFAKERGLSPEQAQAILERENAAVASDRGAQRAAFETTAKTWVDGLKVDREFGGQAFNENAAIASRFVEKFGSPELKRALDETGLGNHPELFKMVVRAARAMGEDKIVIGGQPVAQPPKRLADKLYGKTTK